MTSEQAARPETGVRRRTRTAILEAAIEVWARDWSATLADVADRAGTSRSTLHRYFPERQSLVEGALGAALERMGKVGEASYAESSSPADGLVSVLRSVGEIAPAVLFLYADPARFADHAAFADETEGNKEMLETIRRGQAAGELDRELPAEWVLNMYYSLLYVAAEQVVSGAMTAHSAADAAVRTFESGLRG